MDLQCSKQPGRIETIQIEYQNVFSVRKIIARVIVTPYVIQNFKAIDTHFEARILFYIFDKKKKDKTTFALRNDCLMIEHMQNSATLFRFLIIIQPTCLSQRSRVYALVHRRAQLYISVLTKTVRNMISFTRKRYRTNANIDADTGQQPITHDRHSQKSQRGKRQKKMFSSSV